MVEIVLKFVYFIEKCIDIQMGFVFVLLVGWVLIVLWVCVFEYFWIVNLIKNVDVMY